MHDYLAPVKRMPELRELPFRRRAEPFFRGVRIGASGPSLAVSGGSAGYQFQWDTNPKWDVTVAFARVSQRGKVVQSLGRGHLRFAELAPASITEPHIPLPRKPGVYRSTLVIRSHSGRRLAEFGNYYRVIRPTVQPAWRSPPRPTSPVTPSSPGSKTPVPPSSSSARNTRSKSSKAKAGRRYSKPSSSSGSTTSRPG